MRWVGQSQLPIGLRRRSTAAPLLRLWVRIPEGTWISVSCDCCVLSGRGLWGGLIARPEEPYRLRGVVVCDLETSWTKRPRSALGRSSLACIWQRRNTYSVLPIKHKESRLLCRSRHKWENNIKLFVQKMLVSLWAETVWIRILSCNDIFVCL
jgi:hypothetical protein